MMKLSQLCVMGYLVDKKNKSEGIRVIIYPTEKYLESVKDEAKDQVVLDHMQHIVDEVNKELSPVQENNSINYCKRTS